MDTLDPENTVANVRDELDNYGDHRAVVIRDLVTGKIWNVGTIGDCMHDGELTVAIGLGERIQ